MHTALVIARQHVRGAFAQPLAHAVLALFLGWVALTTLWVDDVLLAGIASVRRPLFWIAAGLTVLAPALTMRLLAEERRSGTLQVVGTWPLGPAQLVLGKWLGTWAVATVALALTATWPLALGQLGPLDPGPVLAGYAAVWLLTGACLAVGTAASAWTRHQILAFLTGFTAIALPWVLGLSLGLFPASWAPWLELLTVQFHLDQLVRGVVDLRSLVVFAGVIAVSLRIAVLALEQERLL